MTLESDDQARLALSEHMPMNWVYAKLRIIQDAFVAPELLQIVRQLDFYEGWVRKYVAIVDWHIIAAHGLWRDALCWPDCLEEWISVVGAPYTVESGCVIFIFWLWSWIKLAGESHVNLNDVRIRACRGHLDLVKVNKICLWRQVVVELNKRATSLPADTVVVWNPNRL